MTGPSVASSWYWARVTEVTKAMEDGGTLGRGDLAARGLDFNGGPKLPRGAGEASGYSEFTGVLPRSDYSAKRVRRVPGKNPLRVICELTEPSR